MGGLEFEGGDEIMDRIHKYIFPNHGSRLTLEDMKAHFTRPNCYHSAELRRGD